MATKDFAVFDNDSHVVEPLALWEKYLDPEYRGPGLTGRHPALLARNAPPFMQYLEQDG